ncbi:hypothetical protein CYLTODRAFT_425995 [Cylindrobasidium torrendii FP15055 ss-10]|uniref:Uncharacterized protein n=1 Tax=Cylindrobasidium torrendii FP15055 ss-10 TaxID=1314674 RepID=A0A0D7B024_9AGAR|nr:hypothetical protein CYLTODRAFT_425995 [Cylindrobasidium torrendii FP15055 ss-10]
MDQIDPSHKAVYNDLLLMSTAMTGITIGIPTPAKRSSLGDVVQAFATLLTVTTPSDPTAENVAAATGTVGVDSVQTIVTTRHNSVAPVDLSRQSITARAQDRHPMNALARNFEAGNSRQP